MDKQLNTKRFWDFIEANVPNYHDRQDVKRLKELQNFIDGQKSSVRGILVEMAVMLRDEILLKLKHEAVANFVINPPGVIPDKTDPLNFVGKLPVFIADETDLHNYAEAIADIAYEAGAQNFRPSGNSRDITSTIIQWANEFAREHQNTDWNEVEYLDTIYEFTEQKLKKQEYDTATN